MKKQTIKLSKSVTDLKIKDLMNALLKLGNVMDISYNKNNQEISFFYEERKVNHHQLKDIIEAYQERDEINLEQYHYTFSVKNLHCANCANKLEKNIKKIPGIVTCNVDFINKKLNMTSKNSNLKDLLKKANFIADKVEPGTKIVEFNEVETSSQNHKLLSILFGVIAFALAYFKIFDEKITIAMYLIAYTIIAYEVLEKAILNIFHGQLFDENFLMSIATIGALIINEYPEAFAVMLFYKIGEIFQDRAVNKSRIAIKNLIDIQPKYANVVINGEINKVNPNYVRINDIILVKSGEKIPLDGTIVEGASTLDKSSLTGESLPVYVEKGNDVLAGSINLNGNLLVQVTKNYEDSAVSKILKLVEDAQSKKAKAEKFITKFAKIYTPIVVILAILILFVPMFYVENYDFNDYLYNACVFLVVSCPCALVLSVPLSIYAGIGVSSKLGILVKGGNYFDLIKKANIIVFDKTGTLTNGNYVVVKSKAIISYDLNKLIDYAAHAESQSSHIVGKAIVEHAKININQKRIQTFEEFYGYGIKAVVDNQEILLGSSKFMDKNLIKYKEVNENGSIVYVAINKQLAGYFVIADEIKKGAKYTIDTLKKQGIKNIIMLTGDSEKVANDVATNLGIDHYYSELLPADKMNILKKIKKENKEAKVMYVGDGVNDTPVMSLADVSVAMGALGSDAAIEVADIVIMNDDLKKIVTARNIASLTSHKVMQNIFFSLAVKFVILGLSMFGYVYIWAAVFADVGVTLLAVLNSVSILRYKSE